MSDDPLQDEQNRLDAEDGRGAEDGATVEERAANGEHLEPVGPPPVGGDVQMSLNLGKALDVNARKVLEATVSLSAAERASDGLYRFDVEYPFLVRGKAGPITTVPVPDAKTGRTKGVKQRQRIDVDTVRRADDPEVVRELFGAILAADPETGGRLLDALREDASARLTAAAA